MAPAGGQEAFDAALKAGADEIYMGMVGFGARRFAQNFSVDDYCRAIEAAHRFGVAINLTFNTLMSDSERESVFPALRQMYDAGLDAAIIQDMGAADFLWSNFPGLSVHASTQLSLSTPQECVWAARQGFSRLVLARELSLNEILAIRTALNASGFSRTELEVFASGALCLCCSGKCLLSSFMGGRSGNRGSCAQPCRLGYERMDNRSEAFPPIRRYLSLKDQWQERSDVERMAAAGIDVIKLEGRMKAPQYVFQAVRTYRILLDELGHGTGDYRSQYGKKSGLGKAEDGSNERNGSGLAGFDPDREAGSRLSIARLFNRGYGKGYLYEHDPPILNPEFSADWGVPAGRVKKGVCILSQPLVNGDGIVYLDKDLQKLTGSNVSKIVLRSQGTVVAQAEPGDEVWLDEPAPREAVYLWKTFDHLWNKKIAQAMVQTARQIPIRAAVSAFVGQKLKLTLERTVQTVQTAQTERKEEAELSGQNVDRGETVISVVRESDAVLELSRQRPATEESLRQALNRFGGTIFYLDNCTVATDGAAFVPLSMINNIRQEAAEELERKIVQATRRANGTGADSTDIELSGNVSGNVSTTVSLSASNRTVRRFSANVWTDEQAEKCLELGVERIYRAQAPTCFAPQTVVRASDGAEEQTVCRQNVSSSEGSVSGSRAFETGAFRLAATLEEAIRLQNQGVSFSLDTPLNITNVRALNWYEKRFPAMDTCFLSVELLTGAVLENKTSDSYSALERLTRSTNRTLGLVVYGRIRDMYTRKTLFSEPMVPLAVAPENQIRLRVYRNRDIGAGETGSSVYLNQPVDYVDQADRLFKIGVQELRFDFTWESPDEIEAIVRRIGLGRTAGQDR